MRSRRRVAAAAVVSACVVVGSVGVPIAAAASKYPPIPKGPITVGASASLSGAGAADGTFVKIEIETALKAFDAEHPDGIDGHAVKVDLLNDDSDVTDAVQVANQLVAEKAAAIVNLTTNPAAEPIQFQVFVKSKTPVVTNLLGIPPGSAKTQALKYPYLFSPNPSQRSVLENAARWIGSNGYKKVAILNDGIPQDTISAGVITASLKSSAPKAKVVSQVTVSPEAVDDSAAITKLKASGAQLLVITAGQGYGPIWEAIQAADWSPTILVGAGAWYSGFTGMGSLTSKAYAYYYECANSPSQKFAATQNQLMAQYAEATDNLAVNYLTFIAGDSVDLEMLDYAITKYHSTSPAAIKAALQGITNQKFLGLTYTFSDADHFGLTGTFGPAVCHMGAPYAGGVGKVPVKG